MQRTIQYVAAIVWASLAVKGQLWLVQRSLPIFGAATSFILVGCDSKSKSDKRTRIDVNQSDEAISQKLLRFTPLGSDALQVSEFVQCCLYYEGRVASGVGIMPKPVLSVKLGHIPGFIGQQSVGADWIFDVNQKLSEIRITRFVEEGNQ